MKTVYYKGSGLMIYDSVLQHFGLVNGQNVSESMLWNLIGVNASLGIAKCNEEINKKSNEQHE